ILTAIRERKAEMEDALSLTGTRMPPSQEAVLRAVAMLPGLDERTRATVKQVLAFLPALGKARRTPEAAAALAALDRQISRAGSVDEVAAGLGLFGNDLRFDKVSGLAVGVNCALEMVRTAEFGAE